MRVKGKDTVSDSTITAANFYDPTHGKIKEIIHIYKGVRVRDRDRDRVRVRPGVMQYSRVEGKG
jgi:hypothetical protein